MITKTAPLGGITHTERFLLSPLFFVRFILAGLDQSRDPEHHLQLESNSRPRWFESFKACCKLPHAYSPLRLLGFVSRAASASVSVSVGAQPNNNEKDCTVSRQVSSRFFSPYGPDAPQVGAKRDCRHPLHDAGGGIMAYTKSLVRRGCFVSSFSSSQDPSWGGTCPSPMDSSPTTRCQPCQPLCLHHRATLVSTTACAVFSSEIQTVVQ